MLSRLRDLFYAYILSRLCDMSSNFYYIFLNIFMNLFIPLKFILYNILFCGHVITPPYMLSFKIKRLH